MNGLDHDWLAISAEEAASDLALQMSPAVAGRSHERLDGTDARKLREKLTGRYFEWTGRDLAADLSLDTGAGPAQKE